MNAHSGHTASQHQEAGNYLTALAIRAESCLENSFGRCISQILDFRGIGFCISRSSIFDVCEKFQASESNSMEIKLN